MLIRKNMVEPDEKHAILQRNIEKCQNLEQSAQYIKADVLRMAAP
jgi:hypothetical protein